MVNAGLQVLTVCTGH